MEIIIAITVLIAIGLAARWAHKRAVPAPQIHYAAKRGPDHDPKEVAGSGMEGYSISR